MPILPLSSFADAPRIDLIQGWEFLPDPEHNIQVSQLDAQTGWRPAMVGIGWNALFEDLRDYLGVAWYRTNFEVPAFRTPQDVLVRFGAIDYFAEVYLNGELVGSHEGGYTPFVVDATSAARPGRNELAIRVIDPPMDEAHNLLVCPEMMYYEIPHGKQNWYVQNAGIWQGVRVEFCPEIYIEQVHVTPNVSGDFRVDVMLAGSGLASASKLTDVKLLFKVADDTGRVILTEVLPVVSPDVQSYRGTVPHPKLWGPSKPVLYSVEVQLTGSLHHRKRVRMGFRKFEARDGKLYLNDEPFYLRGALDQDFYPETIHTPASEEYVRSMMLKAKELGINVLRCHLKVCHPVYLTVADELGMLIWAEVPSWSDCWYPSDHFSLKAADRGKRMFREVIDRDWNHPSIVIQTIMNESWGIDLKDPAQRNWLRDTFDWVKSEIGKLGRLVVDNSACEGNFHIKTDLEDFHNYYSMPDHVERWDKWTSELASRPSWTFSPYGDAERTGTEPIIVSEFGNWGLPHLPDELPWWFSSDFGGREVTKPLGMRERFKTYGLDAVFGHYNHFAEMTQWHQFISLKYEIENIRRQAPIQGHVITGMTDVHWEANGLLDMWRNEKVFAADLAKLQSPDLILTSLERFNFWAGQEVATDLMLSHYTSRTLSGSRVRWSLDSGPSGSFVVSSEPTSSSVTRIGEIRFSAPDVAEPITDRLHLELRQKNGALVTDNSVDVYVFPKATLRPAVPLWVKDQALAEKLRREGYELVDSAESIIVGQELDPRTEQELVTGRRALLILNDESALPPDGSLKLNKRWGTEFDGRWFSNFNWIRTNVAPFDRLTLNQILGFESAAVAPDYVISGVEPQDFADVLAGATFGWVQRNSALVLQLRLGRGSALLTTFRFEHLGTDPYATHLLSALLHAVAASDFSPRLQWQLTAIAG
jgi:hypothetical protein